MLQWLLLFVTVLILGYVSMIYYSVSTLFLAAVILFCAIIFWIISLVSARKLRILLQTPVALAEPGQEVTVDIVAQNTGFLPVGKIRVCLQIESVFHRKRKKYHQSLHLKSDKIKQSISFIPDYDGPITMTITKAKVYNLFDVLPVSKKIKYGYGQTTIFVLPDVIDLSLPFSSKQVGDTIDRDSQLRIQGKKNPPEIADLRMYQPGDLLKSIHWKLSVKQDELIVYEHLSEQIHAAVFYVNFFQVSETFIQVFCSAVMELLDCHISFYLVYYDETIQELLRVWIGSEEEFYDFLLQYQWQKKKDKTKHHPLDWKEEYREKYRQFSYAIIFELINQNELYCNEEVIWRRA